MVGVLTLLATAAPALANTATYDDASPGCALAVAAQEQPQSVYGCSAAQAGSARAGFFDCNPAGCGVRVSGAANGQGGAGLGLGLRSTVRYAGSVATVCSASGAGAAGCAGSVGPLFLPVAPGACIPFSVRTTATAGIVGELVAFRATAEHAFQLCRDMLGSPTISSAAGA